MSITPETKVKVTNRSFGPVVYNIPEQHLRREFTPRETKNIPFSELCEVANLPGGRELLYNFLLIEDEEALREALNVKEEPEYWLTNEKIPSWMQTCALDEFKDALDFAPTGVKDLIKANAVSLPLNDMAKIAAIKEQLGFDVTSAIGLITDAGAGSEAPSASKRRATPTTTTGYKVVSRND